MTNLERIASKLELRNILRESKITCENKQCDYYGNKPVCYSIFYEDCKEYRENA